MKAYSFLSYAHKDWAVIESYYLALNKRGHHIWYDKDILPGTEWIETIAERLKNAASCILFLSTDAVNSYNVRREIHFAAANGIPIIVIAIKPFELSEGLQLELSECRFLYPERLQTFEECIDEISAFISEADSHIYRTSKRIRYPQQLLKYCLCGLIGMMIALFLIKIVSLNTIFRKDYKAEYYSSISDFVEGYYKLINKGDEKSFQVFWDSYVSETTKTCGVITEEEWIKGNLDNNLQHELEIIDYNIINVETFPNNVFAYTSRVNYEIDGTLYSEDRKEYLIVEDQKYKYLYKGILKTEFFEGGESTLDGIRFSDIEIKEYADGLGLTMKIFNETGSDCFIGQADSSHYITIDTTAGSYTGGEESGACIKGSKNITAQFYLASGRLKRIIINGIRKGNDMIERSASCEVS